MDALTASGLAVMQMSEGRSKKSRKSCLAIATTIYPRTPTSSL
ncbi:hypothetical protein JCM19236_1049 [Vibrio sp. JCM 19236]|nr:hypothetical protein JCM19236_1049 [Vibrio sp. JCM 19236]